MTTVMPQLIKQQRMQMNPSQDEITSRPSQLEAQRPVRFTQADLYNYLYRQNQVKPLTEQDLIQDRSFLVYWCSICKKDSQSLCTVHGSTHCKPKQTAIGSVIKSFPNQVQICRSSIPGTLFGVITTCYIPKGTWLGPYEGTKVPPDSVLLGTDHSFMWEIYKQGQLAYYLDGSNEDTSSWMRFIACARNACEQNLYAFQYCGNIYYRAFKEIIPGSELLVWYDDIYPQFMGIPLEIRETEGIYQRAVEPGAKQDQVVVVVSDQEQPSLSLPGNNYPMPVAVPTATPRSPSVFKHHQGYHMNLPRLPDLQSSQLLTRRRQTTRSNSTTTQSDPDNQLPRQQAVPSTHNQFPRQQAAMTIDTQLPRQQAAPSTHNQFPRQQLALTIDTQLPRQHAAVTTGNQLPRQQPAVTNGNQLPRQHAAVTTGNQLPQQQSSSIRTGEEPGASSDVQTRKRVHSESSDQSSPGKDGNAFRCGQCGKTFPQRSVLQIHVCPKQPYKPYHCGHCNRLFDDPNELRNHAMLHTNEKPFKCGYCSRSFSGATTLNNHIRTHTGEKPFECQVCGKTFSQASQLSRHEKIPGDCIEN